MKRRSRRSRKQRKPPPKRKEPTLAELEQELQTIQDHVRDGTLTAAECRKLSNLTRTVHLFQEAFTNGVPMTELEDLIRDPLAHHAKPYRRRPVGSGAAPAATKTEDEEKP